MKLNLKGSTHPNPITLLGDIMKWLIRGLQKKVDNRPSLSSQSGWGEGRSDGSGIVGSHRVFMELWIVIMAANKLYQRVKYKVNITVYSQTLYIWNSLESGILDDALHHSITYSFPRTKFMKEIFFHKGWLWEQKKNIMCGTLFRYLITLTYFPVMLLDWKTLLLSPSEQKCASTTPTIPSAQKAQSAFPFPCFFIRKYPLEYF